MSKISEKVAAYPYAMAIWTDRADFIIDRNDLREDKLLEIRCFGEEGEYHALRTSLSETFSEREIREKEKAYADGYHDEAQYLDIDETKGRTADGTVWTTGGGCYHLPEGARGKKLLLTRTYYRFDEEGVARKCDWRLVGFTNSDTVGREEK